MSSSSATSSAAAQGGSIAADNATGVPVFVWILAAVVAVVFILKIRR
jgi:hypothetical protein